MNVLIIAKEDYLGAGKAALRMYHAFKRQGHNVCFLVKHKVTNDDAFILKYEDIVKPTYFERAYRYFIRRAQSIFRNNVVTDPNYYFFGINDRDLSINETKLVKALPFVPERIIVTWTSQFINAKSIERLKRLTDAKVFAYPLDMSLLTGGCHYAWGCDGYKKSCNSCPAILSSKDKKNAFKNLLLKKKYYKQAGIKAIAASNSLFNEIRESALFKAETLPVKILLPIDEEIFNANQRSNAKVALGFGENKKIIFFGSSFTNEKRKGVGDFIYALKDLAQRLGSFESRVNDIVVVIGGNKPRDGNFFDDIKFDTFFTGYINDDKKLSNIYQAADVFVCTSLQDSGPMMINESLMCGTPVVSYKIGVAEDLIVDGVSGFKVSVGDIKMLSQKISEVLYGYESPEFNQNISKIVQSKTSYKNFPFESFF
jgi:glycosyltransferase involved in cell wall biosynthesis